MSLRRRFATVFATTMLVFVGSFLYLSQKLWNQSYEDLEVMLFKDNVKRIAHAFQDRIEGFRAKSVDWASWDDTYQYIKNKNYDFVSAKLDQPESLKALKSNFMIFTDENMNVLVSRGYLYDNEIQKVEIPKAWFEQTLELAKKQNLQSFSPDGISGVLNSDYGITMTVILPILTSARTGPARGYMIWGSLFNEHEKEIFQKVVNYNVSFETIDVRTDAMSEPSVKMTTNKGISEFQLSDLNGNPAIRVLATFDREVSAHGKKAFMAFFWAFFTLVVIYTGVVIYHVDNSAVRPILEISGHVENIESFSKAKPIPESYQGELKTLTKKLNQMIDRLKDAAQSAERQQASMVQTAKMASLGEMAGGIAHEINNPLAIINGNSQILKRLLTENPVNSKDALERVVKISETAFRISKIVKGLRAFSRDASHDPHQEIAVSTLLDEVIGLCGERLKKHNISLRLPQGLSADLTVQCRSTQVEQVILNLLNNAVDEHMDKPSAWVEIGVRELGPDVEIYVKDSGPGISPEVQAKIFQPFFTTKPVGKGTGLGLSISIGLIEGHGGKLYYDQNSENTCFVVRLPRKQESKQTAAA